MRTPFDLIPPASPPAAGRQPDPRADCTFCCRRRAVPFADGCRRAASLPPCGCTGAAAIPCVHSLL